MSKKKQISKSNPSSQKRVVSSQRESSYDKKPSWSFSRCDFAHSQWGIDNHADKLLEITHRFADLEGMKWSEILTSTAGKRNGTRNHAIGVDEIIKDARDRLVELRLDEFDEVYSLRLSGPERIWGLLIGGVFFVLWYDPKHEIFPSEKKHT